MHKLQWKLVLLLVLTIFLTACVSSNDEKRTPEIIQNNSVGQQRKIPVSAPDSNAAEPAIAAGIDGKVFVVWVEHKSNKEADVFVQQFDAEGTAKSGQIRVNNQPGQATAWRGDPPTVKIAQDGSIYIGWTAKTESQSSAGNTLFLSVSHDGGNSFDSPVKVNDDTAPASHGMHALAIDSEGKVYVAWLDERYLNSGKKLTAATRENSTEQYQFRKAALFDHKPDTENKPEPNAELYFAVSNDGGKTFSVNRRLAENVCPCCKTSLLTALNGRIYISWRQVLPGDFRHIAVATSKDFGGEFSAPVIVSDDQWQINACPVSGAALTANSNDDLTVAWFTGGNAGKQGFYTSESKDGGKTFLHRELVSETATGGTPLLFTDAETNNIVWTDSENIFVKKIQNGKSILKTEQKVASGVFPAVAFTNDKIFITYVEKERHAVNLNILSR